MFATPARVVASCAGQVVSDHVRDGSHSRTITDPEHQATARLLRQDLASRRKQTITRVHTDGHVVAIRALSHYDAPCGVDSDPAPTSERSRNKQVEGK